MAKSSDIPVFGPLQGVKVLSTGSVLAEPFAAALMAEYGADVLGIESTVAPDSARLQKGGWQQEHRNSRTMALNIPSEEGRKVFLRLIKWADIFMESSKGGTYAKWGLTDEVLWEVNPALVIVHVSGYGQWGVEEYVHRPSYDAIAQAFSGYMFINGLPEPNPPTRCNPYTCDYMTGLMAYGMALAALYRAKATGVGDSIDVAQYEVMARMQLNWPTTYYNDGVQLTRNGNADPTTGPALEAYKCSDGGWAYVGCAGAGPVSNLLKILGLDGNPLFKPGTQLVFWRDPGAELLDKTVREFCASHTADEVDQILNENGVPCSKVMNYEDQMKNPQYQARNVIVEWDTVQGDKFKGINVLPHYTKNPGQIWRGAPTYGMDNEDILEEMGYSEDEVKSMYENKVIAKK